MKYQRALGAMSLVVVFVLAPLAMAGAAQADTLDQAKSKAEAAKAAAAAARSRATQLSASANAVAGELTAVMTRLDRLNDDVAEAQAKIAEARGEEATLRSQVRAHALDRYKRTGSEIGFLDLDATEAATKKLVDMTTQRESRVAERWRNAADDLQVEEAQLRANQASVQAEQASIVTKQRDIAARLEQAKQAVATAVAAEAAQLAAYDQAVKAAEVARRADEVRRLQEQRNALSARTTSSGGSGSSGGNAASVGGVRCPIGGSVAFSNDWGQPRSGGRTHQGTDLFSGYGTPNVAVMGGTTMLQTESVGGMSVYLMADDGNTYYYTHLSGFAGGARRVQSGETLGYTGNSGNASGGVTHTHFEIRRGGPNGTKVNPYATLAAAC